jgi:hypothetical protein
MSYLDAAARVSQIRTMFEQVAQPPGTASTTGFDQALQKATSSQSAGAAVPTAAVTPTGESAGMRALDAACSQLGVTEQPPGSNDGPDIARYRSAVAGAYAGAPWCAYFVSWCAAQAGAPIGDGGSGLGSVEAVTAWAQRTGRFTTQPAPGELILFGGRHIGIVESVNADGTLTTIEANTSDGVHRRIHAVSEATGFVRL